MQTISFSSDVPLRGTYDICIVGGGPSGMAAAVTAARGNLQVFLAEGHSCFGGMSTAGMVPTFMRISDGKKSLIPGFGDYLLDRLRKAGGMGVVNPGNLNIQAEVLKRVFDEMVQENHIHGSLQTRLIAANTQDGNIQHAIFHGKDGLFAIAATIFVDATGDGDLCALAGAPFTQGDEHGHCMPASLCSLWSDIDFNKFKSTGKPVQEFLKQAFDDGIFRFNDPHHSGMWEVAHGIGGANIGHVFNLNATNTQELTEGLMEGRRLLPEFERFYRNYVPGFEHCQLVGSASLMGIRESRRIIGDYILNLEDFVNRSSFPDEIGRYAYPVDIHPEPGQFAQFTKNISTYRMGPGESYGIPLRCLLPQKTINLLCVGRCISTDRYMQSSIRVMPGCFITGQGAAAAAVAALRQQTTLRELANEDLHQTLQELQQNFSHPQ